jgi:hypothetical protein
MLIISNKKIFWAIYKIEMGLQYQQGGTPYWGVFLSLHGSLDEENTMKKLLLLAIAAILMVMSVGMANATCVGTGKIVYSFVWSGDQQNRVYIAPQEENFPDYYYWYDTDDSDLLTYIASAQTGGYTVTLRGDANNCPGSGEFRYGGVLDYVRIHSTY